MTKWSGWNPARPAPQAIADSIPVLRGMENILPSSATMWLAYTPQNWEEPNEAGVVQEFQLPAKSPLLPLSALEIGLGRVLACPDMSQSVC